jgi:hypothetical protein
MQISFPAPVQVSLTKTYLLDVIAVTFISVNPQIVILHTESRSSFSAALAQKEIKSNKQIMLAVILAPMLS